MATPTAANRLMGAGGGTGRDGPDEEIKGCGEIRLIGAV